MINNKKRGKAGLLLVIGTVMMAAVLLSACRTEDKTAVSSEKTIVIGYDPFEPYT